MSGKLWGELKPKTLAITDEQRAALKVFEPFTFHQPTRNVAVQVRQPQTILTSHILPDPTVLHSLNLRRYLRELSEFEAIQDQQNTLGNEETQQKGQLPLKLPPKVPGDPLKNNHLFLKYKNSAQKLAGMKLCEDSVKMLLKKSIALILIHVGYDKASERVLTHLAIAVEDYLKQMLSILHKHCDDNASGNLADMRSLEETLKEIGIDGIRGLKEFYDDDVIEVRDSWLSQCVHAYKNFQMASNQEECGDDNEIADKVASTPNITSPCHKRNE